MKISTTLLLLSLRSATVVAFDAAKGHVSPPILADCLELDKNQPLYQPPVITSDEAEWTFDLVVEEGQVGDLLPCGIRYKSRLYNGNVPGPTVRTRRGQTVNISLVNRLEYKGWMSFGSEEIHNIFALFYKVKIGRKMQIR